MQTLQEILYGNGESHWSFSAKPLLGNVFQQQAVRSSVSPEDQPPPPNVDQTISLIDVIASDLKRGVKRKAPDIVDSQAGSNASSPELRGILSEWVTLEHITDLGSQNKVDPQLKQFFQSMEEDLFKQKDGEHSFPRLKVARSWLNQKFYAFSPLVNGSGILLAALLQRILCSKMSHTAMLQVVSTTLLRANQLRIDIPANQLSHLLKEAVAQRDILTEFVLHMLLGRAPKKGDAAPKWGDIKKLTVMQPTHRVVVRRGTSSGFAQLCRVSDEFARFAQKVLAQIPGANVADWATGIYHSRAAAVKIINTYARQNDLFDAGSIRWTPELEQLFGVVPGDSLKANRIQGLFSRHINHTLPDTVPTQCLDACPATRDEWVFEVPRHNKRGSPDAAIPGEVVTEAAVPITQD